MIIPRRLFIDVCFTLLQNLFEQKRELEEKEQREKKEVEKKETIKKNSSEVKQILQVI